MAKSEGNIKRYKRNKGYESINRNMLQDEENLTPGAIGLLSNLLSYPDDWKLYKTELYKRFKKAGRRAINTLWKELVEEGYIVQLRKRNGQKYDYFYYFQDQRFTEEEVKEICEIEKADLWDGSVLKKKSDESDKARHNNDYSTVQNEHFNENTSNRADKRFTTNQVYHQHKKDIDIDTYKDTENPDLSTKEIEKEKDKLLKQSLETDIPAAIYHTLSILSENFDEMYNWFGIVLRAKSKVEKEYNQLLSLKELDEELNQILLRGIRKVKKDTTIDNGDNYLFKTVYNSLEKIIIDLKEENLILL